MTTIQTTRLGPAGAAAVQSPAPTKPAGGGFAAALEARMKRPFDPNEKLLPDGDPDEALKAGLAEVAGALGEIVEQYGIQTPPAIELGIGRNGQLTVGDHPQKTKILAALADRPGFRNAVAKNVGLKQFADAFKEAVAFQKAYAKDPQAAVARFAHLFGPQVPNQPKLLFSIGPEGPAATFAGTLLAFRPPLN